MPPVHIASRRGLIRRTAALLIVAAGIAATPTGSTAQPTLVSATSDVTYVLPLYAWYFSGSALDFGLQVEDLRSRLPEGPLVRVGFSVYIHVSMGDWTIDPDDRNAVRAALSSTVAQIDGAIARAEPYDLPICLNLLTAIRGTYDPVQIASELEDRRNMQWYTDNGLANGWWTHSQYARKARAIQEAYVREIGRILADRMERYPDILVAASGDGEVELSYDRAQVPGSPYLADYSPFTVAEFRDWLRHAGLYAPGQPLAGEGYTLGARYAGDISPAADSNGDGHTLNGDFGLGFSSWDLRYFDWSLSDDPWTDPHAIPSTTYTAGGWNPLPDAGATLFDAPRVRMWGEPWWDTWFLFKQQMLLRHNRDFARWITTSADPASGATVPVERWYSYQIPADYLYGYSPQQPDWRYDTSASAWWTADIHPYGGLGITAFNVNLDGTNFARTLVNVAPKIAERNRRWGILEWNPSVPAADSIDVYRQEMEVVEQYRPSLLVPCAWGDTHAQVQNSPFETALRELIDRIKDPAPSQAAMNIDSPTQGLAVSQPFSVTGWAVDRGTVLGPGRTTGVDRVDVEAYPDPGSGEPAIVLGTATYGISRPDVAAVYGAQFSNSGFEFTVAGLPPGVYRLVVNVRSTVTGTFNNALSVDVKVDLPTLTFDRPMLRFGFVSLAGGGTRLTSSQEVSLAQSAGEAVGWTAAADQPWLQVSPTSGSGTARLTVGVDPANVPAGLGDLAANVSISAPNAASAPVLSVVLSRLTDGATGSPWGVIDTPLDGAAGVIGSIGVTGWALDDVQIDEVRIYRSRVMGIDPPAAVSPNGAIYVGDAAFLPGARPDVEAAFPGRPANHRAGWGYLLLTNMFPHQILGTPYGGQGTYTVYAEAIDVEGHTTRLGQRTIHLDNDGAQKPFGAIDTPGQGDTWSGVQPNFGWALTPGTAIIPRDASTMWVFLDGVSVGHPTYDQCRGSNAPSPPAGVGTCDDDVAQAFPGRTNIAQGNGAIGAFDIDTRLLTNGLHTIAWSVTDDQGRVEGIGSRFFTVFNGSPDLRVLGLPTMGDRLATPGPDTHGVQSAFDNVTTGLHEQVGVLARRGFDLNAPLLPLQPDERGVYHAQTYELDRIEIRLPHDIWRDRPHEGWLEANGRLRPLPPGSTFDRARGIFYWQPGAGYVGAYSFVFDRGTVTGRRVRIPVSIRIVPRFTRNTTSRMWVDLPTPNAVVGSAFVIAGWALDLAAWSGSGVDAVHIWVYRNPGSGEAPVFLGVADVGLARPDVGRAFGAQFDRAGYSLSVGTLAAGVYDLVVHAHSQVTGSFRDARSVRIRVR